MASILVIGAGGVGGVVVHTLARLASGPHTITLASRTVSKCEQIAASVQERTGVTVATAHVDADDVEQTAELIERCGAHLVVHVALPYQDLSIMEACLKARCHYLDTANYEPRDTARFEYSWQWAYRQRFEQAGLTAILGCGFDPGVTNAFVAWIARHRLSAIEELDIVDVNAGNHGKAFATNFNPEINIREVTAPCRHWQEGAFVESPALSTSRTFVCPDGVGTYDVYRMYHEELESLVKTFPTIRNARFWMSFSHSYLNHLKVLENVGMTRIDPVVYQGQQIIPLQFLKAVLPEPAQLGADTTGKTCIGVIARGGGRDSGRSVYLYNICDHEQAYRETGNQAVSFTTGVPAAVGAGLVVDGRWLAPGVWNIEELNPDPFLEGLSEHGLPWNVEEPAGEHFAP